jgi:hypothetical protein
MHTNDTAARTASTLLAGHAPTPYSLRLAGLLERIVQHLSCANATVRIAQAYYHEALLELDEAWHLYAANDHAFEATQPAGGDRPES